VSSVLEVIDEKITEAEMTFGKIRWKNVQNKKK
jgi:hypothetical protein